MVGAAEELVAEVGGGLVACDGVGDEESGAAVADAGFDGGRAVVEDDGWCHEKSKRGN